MRIHSSLSAFTLTALCGAFLQQAPAKGRVTVGSETVEYFDYGDRWLDGKVYLLKDVDGFTPAPEAETGKFGGDPSKQAKATGFFRVEKINDRWWMIDPEGYAFVATGINEIGIGTSPATQEEVDANIALLKANGFNVTHLSIEKRNRGVGENKFEIPWCSEIMLTFFFLQDNFNGDARVWNAPPFWDDAMIDYIDKRAEKNLAIHKDDPYLIGYFTDNEMKWRPDALDRYYDLFVNDEPYEVTGKGGGQAGQTYTVDPAKMKSYKIVGEWVEKNGFKPGADGKFSEEAQMKFTEFMAEQYAKIVSEAVRKVDPNHLVMGGRNIRSDGKLPGMFKGFGKYFDVISMNYYAAWPADPVVLDTWAKWSGRPIMITEFSAQSWETIARKARDAWIVKTQEDRGKYYQNLMLSALQNKNCVGTLWFCYRDFGDDANYGIVNKDDEPYEEFLKYAREINLNRYNLIDTLQKNPLDFSEVYDPLRNVNWSKPFEEFEL
ncbi:MAG: hypothetical protein WA771_15875 [Chthoniobacterales bacterium]